MNYWCPIKIYRGSSEKGINYSASPQRFEILRLPQPKHQVLSKDTNFSGQPVLSDNNNYEN